MGCLQWLVIYLTVFTPFPRSWSQSASIQKKNVTVALYNVENLFDTEDDPETMDDEFTSLGKNRYTPEAYDKKLSNIANVISRIGSHHNASPPSLLGLAEIENRKVLEELIARKELEKADYQIIHFDSPDPRGIDVALLYRESHFIPIQHEVKEVRIWNEKGERVYTRDILWVYGILFDEEIHLLINHWPSRRRGKTSSAPKRSKAAYVARKIIDGILAENPQAKILVLGDFNDNPSDKSIISGLNSTPRRETMLFSELYNPMHRMFSKGWNTMAFRDELHLFDQVLMSWSLAASGAPTEGLRFFRAGIFNPSFLIRSSGPFDGYPFRSFENGHFSGGYSDHYPVYVVLKYLD